MIKVKTLRMVLACCLVVLLPGTAVADKEQITDQVSIMITVYIGTEWCAPHGKFPQPEDFII